MVEKCDEHWLGEIAVFYESNSLQDGYKRNVSYTNMELFLRT